MTTCEMLTSYLKRNTSASWVVPRNEAGGGHQLSTETSQSFRSHLRPLRTDFLRSTCSCPHIHIRGVLSGCGCRLAHFCSVMSSLELKDINFKHVANLRIIVCTRSINIVFRYPSVRLHYRICSKQIFHHFWKSEQKHWSWSPCLSISAHSPTRISSVGEYRRKSNPLSTPGKPKKKRLSEFCEISLEKMKPNYFVK